MRDYELALVLSPLEQKERESVTAKVKKDLESFGGTIKTEDEWGKKTLVYPIKHQNEGVYFLWEISFPPDKVSELEKKILLEEKILRHLLVRTETKKVSEKKDKEVKKEKRTRKTRTK